MIKTITFGEKQVQFSTSFAWAHAYKSQFGQDPMKILMPAIRKVFLVSEGNEAENDEQLMVQASIILEELGLVGIEQIAWASAWLCDKSIPDLITWVESFGDDFEPFTLVTDLIIDLMSSCFTSKNLATPSPKELKPETEEKKAK